ncbi:hypothetical protein DFJ74DRAFT_215331 [Hyaloraphidium curvatum]|nr:hypothetical protein DFJ74DRAFT_215331 [Hyaloraphidium curvatum]
MSARERELATAESELHAAEARLLVAKEETSVAESSLNSVRSSGDADDIARAKRLLDLSIDALATRQSEVSNLVTIVNELRALRVKESKVFTETTSETGSLIANARLAYPDISPKQEVVLATSTMMADFRKILLRGPLESRKIVEFRRRMDAILSTSTRWQFTSETGFVLDGPVTAEGQGASSILYAYSGPLLMCAKLGPRVFREHDVSEAVHRDFICPSVVHMTNKFLVARTARSEQPQQTASHESTWHTPSLCLALPQYKPSRKQDGVTVT